MTSQGLIPTDCGLLCFRAGGENWAQNAALAMLLHLSVQLRDSRQSLEMIAEVQSSC